MSTYVNMFTACFAAAKWAKHQLKLHLTKVIKSLCFYLVHRTCYITAAKMSLVIWFIIAKKPIGCKKVFIKSHAENMMQLFYSGLCHLVFKTFVNESHLSFFMTKMASHDKWYYIVFNVDVSILKQVRVVKRLGPKYDSVFFVLTQRVIHQEP